MLELFNDTPIEAEEVEVMDSLLAQVAVEPRPRNPDRITIPMVSSLYKCPLNW